MQMAPWCGGSGGGWRRVGGGKLLRVAGGPAVIRDHGQRAPLSCRRELGRWGAAAAAAGEGGCHCRLVKRGCWLPTTWMPLQGLLRTPGGASGSNLAAGTRGTDAQQNGSGPQCKSLAAAALLDALLGGAPQAGVTPSPHGPPTSSPQDGRRAARQRHRASAAGPGRCTGGPARLCVPHLPGRRLPAVYRHAGLSNCQEMSDQLSGTGGRHRGPCSRPHHRCPKRRRKTAGRQSLARICRPFFVQALRPAARPPLPRSTT